MCDFSYSLEAEAVMNQFYDVDAIVYVEGKDDVPFWEFILEQFSSYSFEIKDVGSCTALKKYIDRIEDGKLTAIVALDSDFRPFQDIKYESVNIIRTPKYSIENTMINEMSTIESISTLAKISKKDANLGRFKEWYVDFCETLLNSVLLDIYNAKYELGVNVLSDNADMFFESKGSHKISSMKVTKHFDKALNEVGNNFDSERFFTEIKKEGFNVYDFFRGHFLFSAVAKYIRVFIKSLGVSMSISNDALYSTFLLSLKANFTKCEDYEYYREKISNIVI